MIELIFFIVGSIFIITTINRAFRLGHRTTVATEATALSVAILVHALTSEARARADAELARIAEEARERMSQRRHRTI
jgi:hypothetical protein